MCQPTESAIDDEPECWDTKQAKYFCEEYPWIYFKNKKLGCKLCHKVNLNLNKNQGSHIHNITLFHLGILLENNNLV